jgi:hypothetical protein
MQREFIEVSLKAADVVIHPNLDGLSWTEFSKVGKFIERGEEAAKSKLEEITRLVNE